MTLTYGVGYGMLLAHFHREVEPMTYLEVLRQKRKQVLVELDRLRDDLAELSSRLASKEGQLRNLEDLLRLEAGDVESLSDRGATQRSTLPTSQRFMDAAVDVLTKSGKPMHYQELSKELAE